MLKYAIIGFGSLGKFHFGKTAELMKRVNDIKLVALCDVEETAFTTQSELNLGSNEVDLNLSEYNLYNSVDELLEKEELDFVMTVLPTYIHEEIAVKIMKQGIHVFSEKPMALNLEQAQNMINASKENNVKLMIGQCLRYWPEYVVAKELIDNKKYGKVLYAYVARESATPKTSWQDWMRDEAKSGGAAMDLHVHDVDFINWAFGKPDAVTSRAVHYSTKFDTVTTTYDYGDMYVNSIGAWGFHDKFPFTMYYLIRFENATVEARQGSVMVYTDTDEYEIELNWTDPYVNEMVDFIDCIRNDKESETNPPEASMLSLQIALNEKISAQNKETVFLD